MQFSVIDTQTILRRLLDEPDATARTAIYQDELIAPYRGLIDIFGGGEGWTQFKQWAMFLPEDFGNGERAKIESIMARLNAFDAQRKMSDALEDAAKAFAPFADRIALDTIQVGLFPVDKTRMMATDRGYSGFGGMPGYIMVIYSDPTAETLHFLQGATVHELHHNIRFSLFRFIPMQVTLADYIVAEGLAESFAGALYGADKVGFYVTDFDESRLDESRRLIGAALESKDFNAMRGYVFGDVIARLQGLPEAGVPDFAGYAMGYRAVQAYLKKTGKSVMEATFVPADEIIRESGFFG